MNDFRLDKFYQKLTELLGETSFCYKLKELMGEIGSFADSLSLFS